MPLGGDDDGAGFGHEALAGGRVGAWGESRPAQLLDSPGAANGFDSRSYRSPAMRRGLGIALWGFAGAAIAAAAIVFTTGSAATRRPAPPRTTASEATAIATHTPTKPSHPRLSNSQTQRPASARGRNGKKHANVRHIHKAPASQAAIVPTSYSTTVRHSTSGPTPQHYSPPARTVEPAQTTPERTSATKASSTSAAQSSAANRPAFGANGLLGPGSSPDG